MVKAKLQASFTMSWLLVLLTLVVAAGGLFFPGVYRESNSFILTGWYANDLVTLIIALPTLLISLILAIRGSYRGQLVWLGMLYYILYNFSFYLFGAAFNAFFMFYVLLFVLSMFALIFGLVNLNVSKIGAQFRLSNPASKCISGFLMVWAILLGIAWFGQWLDFVLNGNLPQIMRDVEATNNLVAAFDFTLAIPFLILAAIWLWKRQVWGYILAVTVCIKGLVYTFVLTLGSFMHVIAGVEGGGDLIPLWIIAGVAYLVSTWWLLKNMEERVIDEY